MNRNRRDFLETAGTVVLGLAAFSRSSVAKSVRRPNVVFILTDDQGTLAVSGVRFTQAYAHTVCCPARAMLMTGRHPVLCQNSALLK